MPINFYNHQIELNLKHKKEVRDWLNEVATEEGVKIDELSYIFCDDEYLLSINQQYLNHDTYTDIITFDLTEEKGIMNGEVYISIERVGENAKKFKNSPEDELHRVMVHGLLHLIGYDDKNPAEKAGMREKEDACLSMRGF